MPDRGRSIPFRKVVLGVTVGLVALVIAVAVTATVVAARNRSAQGLIDTKLVPAQDAAAVLETAYIEQENAVRGELITGDQIFLGRYRAGVDTARRAEGRLAAHLSSDANALRLLRRTERDGATWQERGAAIEIASRPQGAAAVARAVLAAHVLFAKVRVDLADLQGRVAMLTSQEVDRVHLFEAAETWVAGAMAAVAVGLGALTVVVVRRSLDRPIDRLLARVRTVADGQFDEPVQVDGPAEVVAIGEAVETMRQSIVAQNAAAAETERRLAIAETSERIAQDMHDTVIQRLFGAGLQLEALARADAERAGAIETAAAQIDTSIRELRIAVSGLVADQEAPSLRDEVTRVVAESSYALGFRPHLEIDGLVDDVPGQVVRQLVPCLTEMLSNVARHAAASEAQVHLAVAAGDLCLVVSDNGKGLADSRPAGGRGQVNLRSRAEKLGGTCRAAPRPEGGTVVEWRVPVSWPPGP